MLKRTITCFIFIFITSTAYVIASDWTGFRGSDATGASGEKNFPVKWSETENLKWKTALPGPGSSSPIVIRDLVFVTCYSGYGLDRDKPGEQVNLKRHLLCINAVSGKVVWDKSVPAVLPEDPYKGMFREHGYASQTPATDGERIYVFFGKSGVLAFDFKGNKLWQRSVGTGSDEKKWGSASSPVVYKDLVIVNAWDESKALYGLNKKTGDQVWKKDLSETGLTFSTPVLVTRSDGQGELVVSLQGQLLGLDPLTSDQLWISKTGIDDSVIPSPVIVEGTAYINAGGPKKSGSLAVRTGGKGDVTDTNILWSSKEVTSPPSPVVVDGLIFWVNGSGMACCMDAATGKVRYSEKLPVTGRFASYASVVYADGKVYAVTRKGGTFVLEAKPEFNILANNIFASDESDFNASPAISNGRILIRSDRYLYCLKKTQ